ncbi:Cbb3-type cytochrome oxidase component FixQ [Aquimixticola soesokkakensis]|uniref:Cbb3-type cytochrome oxidase component FixQ n=1 Tax=Aquimixticola soesokkakensis TaxID=1519096 RepID=A0A1Y5SW11_9RHOB|nr:cbb3-type cytochrome c oxidase subunit 3 [Aquimixticola soesokkakensis]SLN47857.1 Cbb3-type cytochrome oxidase component FixQ [Aquimixticola soesokkakensis]
MTYHIFREIADSWVLLAMFVFFTAASLWVFRPGSGASHAEAAGTPFRHEDAPAADRATSPEEVQK